MFRVFFLQKVESWLQHLEDTVHKTVRLCIVEVMLAYEEKQREQWVFDCPAQVMLKYNNGRWYWDPSGLRGLPKPFQDTQLNALITKIMTCCTIDVHTRDVVANLVTQKVCVWIAFAWLSQLRHRWGDAQKHCFANMCDAQFRYFYESLGNNPRLIITPLTDRYANNHFSCVQVLHYSNPVSPPNEWCCCRTS
uniref:Uncharacterized protein n=1 Tax=Strix occidentalis caurina TaxID=311401 RepID=A0A8D0EJ11_STROC